ncbi:MAG: hypothetical protein CVV25_08760 [Ignavibacteriae bacterium HGW-Ignavibacteriae-4]|jgi:hypothetical protein|nr:MAG: hypothetical protein CVV25_08760 [Ignavibacteriae bacterium HGW-Ignavibacteriae-4]
MSQTMLLRLFLTTSIIFYLSNSIAFTQVKGSNVEIYTKSNEVLKGELISVDSNKIELLKRLPKTPTSSASHKTIQVENDLCDSVVIPGSFTGASPYVISGLLGIGAAAITIGSSDEPNYYVGGALGAIVGFFSYIFIDNTLSVPEIKFTEIDKYPWKLIPYSRDYRPN